MIKITYLKKNGSLIGCIPRMFHPTIDIFVPILNNNVTPMLE